VVTWNPWHGCHKISAGCRNCYVYRIDARFDRDSTKVEKTANFNLPLKHGRDGRYKLRGGETVYTCLTSDFFLPEADGWRAEAWQMIRLRQDLHFVIITKRIERFYVNLPADWGGGYGNVTICVTAENQDRADFRLPLLLALPARNKEIVCEPLLEEVDLSPYLTPEIGLVVAGGESGDNARVCDYEWVLKIREQCRRAGVPFYFKQTGAVFRKDGRIYRIPRRLQHAQAQKAGIDLP